MRSIIFIGQNLLFSFIQVPHFHHEMVYEGVVAAIEDMHDAAICALVKLLKECDRSGIVTPQQMQRVS